MAGSGTSPADTGGPRAPTPIGEVVLRPARADEAEHLAEQLRRHIPWSRLIDLGPAFLRLLHRHIIHSRHSTCLVAERNGERLGFLAGTLGTSAFFRDFVWRRGLVAACLLGPQLFLPSRARTILHSIAYFRGEGTTDQPPDPDAEILNFLVEDQARGTGVARKLFDAYRDQLARQGVHEFLIGTVKADNTAAIAFYEKMGCERLRTEGFYHDTEVHVYRYRAADGSTANGNTFS